MDSEPTRFRVLVLCTGNSARSQIAEALLATRGGDRVAAASAGSDPASRVNPLALRVLSDNGIAWPEAEPRGLEGVIGKDWHLVITVCDHARQACPVLPGARAQVHWGLEDPAAVAGSEESRLEAFRTAYRSLERRVSRLLELPLEQLSPDDLERRAAEIHRTA